MDATTTLCGSAALHGAAVESPNAQSNIYTDRDLAKIEFLLNNRPRKALGFKIPAEVFDDLLSNVAAGVALQACNHLW